MQIRRPLGGPVGRTRRAPSRTGSLRRWIARNPGWPGGLRSSHASLVARDGRPVIVSSLRSITTRRRGSISRPSGPRGPALGTAVVTMVGHVTDPADVAHTADVARNPDSTSARGRLLDLIKEKAVVHGSFILSSGRTSTFYLDLRRVTLDAVAAPLVGQVMLERTRDLDFDAVGGLTMGADPVATAMLHVAAARGR